MRAAEPFDLAQLTLRNRLVGTAHGRGIIADGLPLPEDADYWRRLAAGGAAMLTVGGTVVAPESTWRRRITTEAWRPEAVPGMAARAEAIRAEGAVAACQLVHLGRETTGAEQWFLPVAPSAVRSPREPTRPRPLSAGELDAIVEGFRISAANAAEAGFQVIELHAAHGYLLAQFLSAETNRRPGAESLEERLAIVDRIVREIRSSAPDVAVGIRLSTDGGEEAGLTLDGLQLLPHVSALADYVNLTVGVRTTYVRDMGTEEPPLLGDVGRIRRVVDRPLLISHAFRTPDTIEAALAAGADLVGMARALIADPDMPRKLLGGRARDIRPCVACNEDCRAFDPVLLCSVNPELAPPGADRRPAAPLVVRRSAEPAAAAWRSSGPDRQASNAPSRWPAAARSCCSTRARRSAASSPSRPPRPTATGGRRCWTSTRTRSRGWSSGRACRCVRTISPASTRWCSRSAAPSSCPSLPGIERALPSSQAIGGRRRLSGRRHLLVVDDGFGWWPCASAVELGVREGFETITVATPGPAFAASLPPEGRVQLLARLRGAPLDVRPFTALERRRRGRRGPAEHDVGQHRASARRRRRRGRRARRARLERAGPGHRHRARDRRRARAAEGVACDRRGPRRRRVDRPCTTRRHPGSGPCLTPKSRS